MNRGGDAHATRLGQLFHSLGQDDASARHSAVREDHFPHRDSYANSGSDVVLDLSVVFGLVGLEGKSGGDRIRGPLELRQQGVAPQFPNPAMIADDGVAEASEGDLNPFVGNVLILLNQGSRLCNVSVQENGELPGSMRRSHVPFPECHRFNNIELHPHFENPISVWLSGGARDCSWPGVLGIVAVEVSERYRISYRDGDIAAAASCPEAPMLYSEDLNHPAGDDCREG